MNSGYQQEDAVLEADKVLRSPLVSVLSGENFIEKRSDSPYRSPKGPTRFPFLGKQSPATRPRTRRDPYSGSPGPLFSPASLKFPSNSDKEPSEQSIGHGSPQKSPQKRGSIPKIPSFALIIVTIVVSIGGAGLLAASFISRTHPVIALPDEDSAQAALMAMLEPEPVAPASDDTALPPLPPLLVERTYTVRRGDTLQTIARQFGLREDTIISANNLSSKNQLVVGKMLRVPNMNGVYHTVKKNENLSLISKAYGVDVTRIADANNISSATLRAGDRLFIPSARLSSSALRNFYGETFIWPARGTISSPFGYRTNPFSGERTFHSAIDIVVNRGTPVKATREGKVADTGYNAVFGNYVIVRHADGYQSLYAHLDTILTHKGASVNQGDVLGRSGNTGQSTGPHLHFGMFRNGQAVDPRKYLP